MPVVPVAGAIGPEWCAGAPVGPLRPGPDPAARPRPGRPGPDPGGPRGPGDPAPAAPAARPRPRPRPRAPGLASDASVVAHRRQIVHLVQVPGISGAPAPFGAVWVSNSCVRCNAGRRAATVRASDASRGEPRAFRGLWSRSPRSVTRIPCVRCNAGRRAATVRASDARRGARWALSGALEPLNAVSHSNSSRQMQRWSACGDGPCI